MSNAAEAIARVRRTCSLPYADDHSPYSTNFQFGPMRAIIAYIDAQAAEIERLRAERDALERTLLKHGFKRCDQPNCCGSWHGGHANERLLEISDALQQEGVSLEGETLLSTIERLIRTKKYPKKIVASAGSRRARHKN